MGADTKIEWCDHTFNPWIGCTKISNGSQPSACDFCYAETMAKFRGWAEWGQGKPRHRTAQATWAALKKWDRAAEENGLRDSVFVASLADWGDTEVPDDWRAELADAMLGTTCLDYLMLTKRHAVAQQHLERHFSLMKDRIRVGFTIENQPMAALRLPYLHKLSQAGWRTFVSYEPALGAVIWRPWLEAKSIGWLIAGGESGPKARPAHPDWFRVARDACADFGVPFFFKQWGDWGPGAEFGCDRSAVAAYRGEIQTLMRKGHADLKLCYPMQDDPLLGAPLTLERYGKKIAGAVLDGREHREFPT